MEKRKSQSRREARGVVLAALVLFAVSVTAFAAGKAETAAVEQPGSITVYSAGPGGLANAIRDAFVAETGIAVELFQSTTGAILGRLEAEKDNPIADIVVLASWPSAFEFKSSGLTLAYPGAANVDKMVPGWVDSEYHFFGYSASALGVTYNTETAPAVPVDWSDFTKPEWRGLVNIPDPLLSGSALDFISGYINVYGDDAWELFAALKANDVLVAGANNPALEPVVTGAKAAVLAGVDYMGYVQASRGESVAVMYPESGTVVNPRPAFILRSSRNPDGARRFIDFLLSDAAQQLVVNAYLLPGRADAPVTNRDPLSVIPVLSYDWDWMSENAEAIARRFTEIFQQ